MDTYYPLSQIPANKLERIESGDNHGIEEVRVGKSKECMDTVSDNNLMSVEQRRVWELFGCYIKYYVKCYKQWSHVSMHLRSCCQLKQWWAVFSYHHMQWCTQSSQREVLAILPSLQHIKQRWRRWSGWSGLGRSTFQQVVGLVPRLHRHLCVAKYTCVYDVQMLAMWRCLQ